MVQYKIIDNILSDSDFTELTKKIIPTPAGVKDYSESKLHWDYLNKQTLQYNDPEHLKKITNIELLDPLHQWILSHVFFDSVNQSYAMQWLAPLLEKIKPLAIFKVTANFTVQQEKTRGRSIFHIDYGGIPHKHIPMITSIFYMNTTNGPTILEDGTEIECRANRLVSYPYGTYHAGVLCTDQPYRIVINLNYFGDSTV